MTPSGSKARVDANLAAVRLSRRLEEEHRPATTTDERRVLAGWSSWGAVPQVFDRGRDEFGDQRAALEGLLTPAEFDAARRTTVNAHYTDPAIAGLMWEALQRLGINDGQVLEPGSGSGTFLGLAPDAVQMTGVELDPVTARIARALYPSAEVRTESFADSPFLAGHFDAAIGNVPFADVVLHDRRHNPGGHVMDDHFIVKSLNLVRPGGVAAFLTSSFTMDRTNPAARREMHALADLVGAVRLPSGSHRRTAGTEVVTDLLLFRRREAGRAPGEDSWTLTQPLKVDDHVIRVGGYFAEHRDQVLGRFSVGQGMYGAETVRVV
ncbi:MAG: helicase, partial [Nakamurella sp.]